MKPVLVRLLVVLGLALADDAAAADAPKVQDIRFIGNRTTEPATMLRELKIKVGDNYDAERAEASRQAIQDLGLFRSVALSSDETDTGIWLTFTVDEKWYLQAYPRLSANSDGQTSVGAELRWNNIRGLNHSLRLLGRSRDSRDADRGRDLSYRASYVAPFVLGERTGLRGSLAHNVTPFTEPAVYDETLNEAELLATYAFGRDGSASQGWTLSAGPLWRDHQVSASGQIRSYGSSLGLATQLDYWHRHNKIYSDEGRHFSLRFELADRGLAADYSYSLLSAEWNQSLAVGSTAHQTLDWGVRAGLSNNGLTDRPTYSLGGHEGLRGFDRRSFEGDRYYLAHVQLMRPVIWDSLRATLGLELGSASYADERVFGAPQLSLNVGLRFRPRRLVNFEVELGIALPLSGDGSRFYAEKIDD